MSDHHLDETEVFTDPADRAQLAHAAEIIAEQIHDHVQLRRVLGRRGELPPVDGGRAAIAFSMYPTSIKQLMAIADAGQIMPPKSTWFEPKLRSGLYVYTLD